MKISPILLLSAILLFTPIAYAHPGRTDSAGCHTCRTNCASWGLSTGEYHCHNAKAVPQPLEPIKSTYGANGTGTTKPAPEYKAPALGNIGSATDDATIKNLVTSEKDNYFKNHNGFRERLIDNLIIKGFNKDRSAFYVYTTLLDIK
jgi:hypothetical protein